MCAEPGAKTAFGNWHICDNPHEQFLGFQTRFAWTCADPTSSSKLAFIAASYHFQSVSLAAMEARKFFFSINSGSPYRRVGALYYQGFITFEPPISGMKSNGTCRRTSFSWLSQKIRKRRRPGPPQVRFFKANETVKIHGISSRTTRKRVRSTRKTLPRAQRVEPSRETRWFGRMACPSGSLFIKQTLRDCFANAAHHRRRTWV